MPANEKDLLNKIRNGVKAINQNATEAQRIVSENEEKEVEKVKSIPLRTAEEIAEEVRLENLRRKG